MNRTRAKLLHKASVLLAKEPAKLRRRGGYRGTWRYPKYSARHIYQRLKRECPPAFYEKLKQLVLVSKSRTHSPLKKGV